MELLSRISLIGGYVAQTSYTSGRLRQLAARIPGPEPWPLVGNAPLFCRNPQRAFQTVLALIEQYGPTIRIWIGSKLYIVVTDPQDIACVLGNSSMISRDSYINRLASNLMGQSLITASGELWKAHRKIVAPAFSSNVLQVVLDYLLAATESGGRLSETELQDEVNTLLSAGYETTATTICFALLLLGMYPRVQDNLVAELDAVFGDDPQRTPTAADLRRLHYLDAVIKETLRLFPPAPIIHREVETSELKIGGCTLPVGASVLVLSYSAHRHPDHFDSPQHFCPERFSEPRARPRHPYAYVPFGAGPRICVGRAYGLLLAKAAVAAVLRRLRVESRLTRGRLPRRAVPALPRLLPPGGAGAGAARLRPPPQASLRGSHLGHDTSRGGAGVQRDGAAARQLQLVRAGGLSANRLHGTRQVLRRRLAACRGRCRCPKALRRRLTTGSASPLHCGRLQRLRMPNTQAVSDTVSTVE
ncbi:probable cytochrome P450 4e1 [Schistocerca americana]|uniref:probable cytochrome P450 4e1 n=1 Tax=Schistocerca americana TaxID=7009 RepID=UPI001F4FA031|nr:probable cytochrome P450 4e1 [Schistocerca americana]